MSHRVFDISEWQSSGTVQQIVNLGAEGVILRIGVTYGGVPNLDDKFIEFVNEVVAAGLPYGIYYYSKMQNYEMAEMEIQWINDRVYELLNGQEPPLGVWLDMEDEATKFDGVYEIVKWSINKMKEWGFKKVGIYTGYSYANSFMDLDDLEELQIPMWIANYDSVNWLKEEHPGLNHVGWQYTESFEDNILDCSEWYEDF